MVYGKQKMSNNSGLQPLMMEEERAYTCGLRRLLPGNDELVMKEGRNCNSIIEITYYSGTNAIFEEVCIHCGSEDIYWEIRFRRLRENWQSSDQSVHHV